MMKYYCPQCEKQYPASEKIINHILQCECGCHFKPVVYGEDALTLLMIEIEQKTLPDAYEKTRDNVLLIKLYDDIQLLQRQTRYGQFDDAMKTAAEIAVKAAVYAAEERKG